MKAPIEFKNKTLKEIRLWAWAAAVLPLTALAGIFFVWTFFDHSILGYAMIIGETAMFCTAVIWWWWAMYVFKTLLAHWDGTREKVSDVLVSVTEIKNIIKDLTGSDK